MLSIVPVVTSDNGYVAGFVFFPILLLGALTCLVLFIVGIAYLVFEKTFGLYFLLAMILLPTGFFGAAFTAKYFEIGAYREEPLVPMTPPVGNIILFRKGTTQDEINSFLDTSFSVHREDGRGYDLLPAIRGRGSLPDFDGHPAFEFHFFANATVEQREYAVSLARSSPIVAEVKENVSTDDYMRTTGASTDAPVDNTKTIVNRAVSSQSK